MRKVSIHESHSLTIAVESDATGVDDVTIERQQHGSRSREAALVTFRIRPDMVRLVLSGGHIVSMNIAGPRILASGLVGVKRDYRSLTSADDAATTGPTWLSALLSDLPYTWGH